MITASDALLGAVYALLVTSMPLNEADRRWQEYLDELEWLRRSLEAESAPQWLRDMVRQRWIKAWYE